MVQKDLFAIALYKKVRSRGEEKKFLKRDNFPQYKLR